MFRLERETGLKMTRIVAMHRLTVKIKSIYHCSKDAVRSSATPFLTPICSQPNAIFDRADGVIPENIITFYRIE